MCPILKTQSRLTLRWNIPLTIGVSTQLLHAFAWLMLGRSGSSGRVVMSGHDVGQFGWMILGMDQKWSKYSHLGQLAHVQLTFWRWAARGHRFHILWKKDIDVMQTGCDIIVNIKVTNVWVVDHILSSVSLKLFEKHQDRLRWSGKLTSLHSGNWNIDDDDDDDDDDYDDHSRCFSWNPCVGVGRARAFCSCLYRSWTN